MKIGIVNDVEVAIEAIRRALATSNHEVAWVARNGADALARCQADTPDLILMDLLMPVMGGVEATRRIMTDCPCAILVVTATVEGNAAQVFEAMGAGALDAVQTPRVGFNGAVERAVLLAKITMIGRLIGEKNGNSLPYVSGDTTLLARKTRLLAVGSSAGGPGALAKVLQGLPKDFPAAVVIIQHVDSQFALELANWLNESSQMPVRVAVKGDCPTAGTVLLAGTNDHLILESPTRLNYTPDPADYCYRPSVDVFFESVAQHWPGEVVGVLLTGMGRDGAKGLKKLHRLGFYTIAQDQTTSAVYGMPKAAAELQAASIILPLEKIAPAILGRFRGTPKPTLVSL